MPMAATSVYFWSYLGPSYVGPEEVIKLESYQDKVKAVLHEQSSTTFASTGSSALSYPGDSSRV